MCDRFKKEQCYTALDKLGKHNCWANQYKTDYLDLGPQWVRREISERFGFKHWVSYDENLFRSPRCSDLLKYLRKRGQMVAMSENTIPFDGICQGSMVNVIIVRDPMSRLISHFRHLYASLDRSKKSNNTAYMSLIKEQSANATNHGVKYFNITTMMNYFDIMTDNFYMRSLNDAHVYRKRLGFDGQASKYFDKAINNLRKFDWVLILDGEESDEGKNNDFILKNGLGLDGGLGRSRISGKEHAIDLTKNDRQIIMTLNSYDAQIWEEAKKLNALDIISLKKLSTHGGKKWFNRMRTERDEKYCCGRVCY